MNTETLKATETLDPVAPAHVDDLPLWERLVTLTVILVPPAALIAAMVFAWGWGGLRLIDLVLLVGMYIATGLGVTIGYHRLFTHRSFETGRVMRAILGVLGSMACEGTILRWVATHRCHHQNSDEAADPHSPHRHGTGAIATLRGFWDAQVGWMFKPLEANIARYAADLKKDRLVRTVSALFPLWVGLGLLIPGVIAGLITQSWWGAFLGVLWGGLIRIFVVHHTTWSINSVCHIWGSRPFDSHDESRNNALCAIVAFGEGWHNNHHAFPSSARHGLKWWQFDSSYLIIKLMSKVGLAHQVRTPSPERIEAKRQRR